MLARLKTSTERLEKQGEFFYQALDKRIDEVNQRISEVRSEISNVRSEISKLNQNHIDHLTHHDS